MNRAPPSAAARRGRRQGLTRSAALGSVIALVFGALGFSSGWRGLEERAQGVVAAIAGPRPWNPQVVIVEVDEKAMREFGWPISRGLYAQVVAAAAQAGAKVAAFDVFFVSPSPEPDEDLLLGGVAQSWGRVVLPAECLFHAGGGDTAPTSLPSPGPTPALRCGSLNLPAPMLRGDVTLSQVHVAASPSGYFRALHAWLESGQRRMPSLAIAAFVKGQGKGLDEIRQEPRAIVIGGTRFPVEADGTLLPSHRGLPAAARVPLRWVISQLGGAPPDQVPAALVELFKGKHVLIGQTAASIGDHGPVITGEQLPLIAVHAALLSDLLEGATMRVAGPGAMAGWVVLSVLLLTAIALGFRPSVATGVGATSLVAFVAAAVLLVGQRWLVAPVAPIFAGIFAFAGALATRLTVQERERRVLRSAFGAYVDPAVLERVLEDPDRYLALGGAKKRLSVLFSDIKGYTGLSNELPADQVVQLLREYLAAMAQVVKRHEGRIDKIMGDGILAVFGDPIPHDDHALRAVTVGVQMLEEVARLQHLWSGQGKKGIAIRIGVATGEVFVGNIGSVDTKIEYTVLGPTVNLASRLEGKAPAGGMLVSEETYQACQQHYAFHAIGGLALKGYTGAYQAWLFVGGGLESDPERQAPRLPTQAPATVRLGGVTVQGLVENVSAGGLYVIAEGAVAPGDQVELEFAASPPLGAPVTVRAEVRHVGKREDGRQGFGVRIERADAQRGEDLRHFVALFLGPQPDAGRVDSGGDTFRIELGEAYGRLIRVERP